MTRLKINWQELRRLEIVVPFLVIILMLIGWGTKDVLRQGSKNNSLITKESSSNQAPLSINNNSSNETICIDGLIGLNGQKCQPQSSTAQAGSSPSVAASSPALSQKLGKNDNPCASSGHTCAWLCSQAQDAYDQVSSSTINRMNSEYWRIMGQTDIPLDTRRAEVNQEYAGTNTELQQEYSGYLQAVHAVPSCVAYFQPPIMYKML